MSRITVAAMLALTVLAACGVDGEPVQPSMNATVGLGSSGIYARGGIGLDQGPVSLYLGF
jgi:hypothetical protein